ncbi:MFS transporter [Brevibacillus formosus]|uniref:MFS transporter n=1 Tax=Brevibacillus formosus TaxID=54913 RepID=UPI0018CFB309|nr:MFS transporter [Brevibacillus formosus]
MNYTHSETTRTLDTKRWWALFVLLLGTFMVILDSFIVNVAIPTIQEQLHASTTQIQFIVASYVLSYAVLLIAGARLGDWQGRKRMFLVGMGIFIAASALCGFSLSAGFLIFSRVIQGIGAAILIPQVLSIIQVIFPPEERGKAIGFYGAVSGLGLIAGQIIGGTLLHFDLWGLGWRAVFLINLPIGILAMLMIIPLLKETPSNGNQKIDVRGIIILTWGLLLLVYPLVVGREAGWPLWIYLSFGGAIALFFLYQFHEKRMTLRGDEPLIRVNIFKERTFTLGVFTILAYQIGNSGFFLVVSMTLQDALSLSAIDSAIAFIPIGFAFFIASLLGPKRAKTNTSVLKWGAALLIAGYAAVIAVCSYYGNDLHWQQLIMLFFLIGLGQGFVGAPLMGTIMSGVPKEHVGSASGILSTFMQTANALGIAAIGSVFFAVLSQAATYTGTSALQLQLHSFIVALACSAILGAVTFTLILCLQKKKSVASSSKTTLVINQKEN